MAVKVLVVDDHEIVRRGIASLIADTGIELVAEAATGEEATKLARKHKPDVVLLDVRMGKKNGLDSIRQIRSAAPNTRVVMLSAFDNTTYVARAVSAGAHDYVLKSATRKELLEALTNAAKGTSPSRSGELRRIAGAMSHRTATVNSEVPLTPRETQVLRLIAMGLSNKEIGDSLEISIETVKEHVQNLLRKISLDDRTQAAVWAIRHGLD
ncbi:MAG: response regulator transcription factor [Planctomycetota bacterium]